MIAAILGHWVCTPLPASPQFSRDVSIELSPAKLDTLDRAEQKHLDRAEVLFADAQWDEGIATLRRIVDEFGDKLIEMPAASDEPEIRRFLTLRSFVQWRISALPPAALATYRRQVDAPAKQAFDAAVAAHDRAALQRVVEDYFCSSWGDDALLACGDAALHAGDADAAREAWRRITPLPPALLTTQSEPLQRHFHEIPELIFRPLRNNQNLPAAMGVLLDEWYELQGAADEESMAFAFRRLKPNPPLQVQTELARIWKQQRVITDLSYPDTTLSVAEIHARLILASILSQDQQRAEWELSEFEAEFADAEGQLAGRQVVLSQALQQLLAESSSWPALPAEPHWSTFGGDVTRQRIAPGEIDIRAPLWERELKAVNVSVPHQNDPLRNQRPGESEGRVLSYFPVVWKDAIFVCDQTKIYAFRLIDGEPYWPGGANRSPGEIFADSGSPIQVRQGYFGAPRFTLTIHDDRLYARMGTPITDRLREGQEQINFREEHGYLVCLDLSREGRLLWKIEPDAQDWAFEGTPITDGRRLWVGMRRGNLQPEANVACFDVETQQMLWRTPVCSANTPARSLNNVRGQITHNLLTLDQGTLYYNTNLGCVAALDTHSGRIRWATAYPREPNGQEIDKRTDLVHLYRDLNPCLVADGRVFFAPADNARIFALDAASGILHWKSVHDSPEDANTLLAVAGGNVIASGDRAWWFRASGGRFVNRWPESETLNPMGFGRGVLVGDDLYWPTRGALHVLDQADARQVKQPIDLRAHGAIGGGNLLVFGEYVVLVSPDMSSGAFRDKITVYRRSGGATEVTARRNSTAEGPSQNNEDETRPGR